MNDFLSLAQKRYAVRSYLPKPVEVEKLERILEAGRVAPTAKNTQPFRFLVVQHPERLKKLSACTNVKATRWRSSSAVLLPKSGCVPLTARASPTPTRR